MSFSRSGRGRDADVPGTPPHRSRRAELPHRALALGVDAQALRGIVPAHRLSYPVKCLLQGIPALHNLRHFIMPQSLVWQRCVTIRLTTRQRWEKSSSPGGNVQRACLWSGSNTRAPITNGWVKRSVPIASRRADLTSVSVRNVWRR